MTTKTIECVECGASVPYGRLSCPSCGSLLASVSGARKPAAQVIETVEVAAAIEPEPNDDLALSLAAAADPPIEAAPVADAPVAIEPLFAVEPDPVDADEADPATADWAPVEEPAPPVLVARPYTRSSADDGPGILASLPSAYRPSTLSISAAAAGGPSWSAVAGSAPIGTYAASTDTGREADESKRNDVVDVARFGEIAGWFVVVGASMSILGFLLPWSVTVIGSRSIGGYFGSWGLASPSHVLVLLGLLAVLALGVLHTPVPDWIRTGILGLAVGGLLIGLVWPYLVGPLGADVGVLITALGGVSLVIGGAVASWATRHVEVEPPV